MPCVLRASLITHWGCSESEHNLPRPRPGFLAPRMSTQQHVIKGSSPDSPRLLRSPVHPHLFFFAHLPSLLSTLIFLMTTSDLPTINTSAISPVSAYSTLMHHRSARSGSAVSATSTASTASSASLTLTTDSRSACSSAFPSYDDLFYSPPTPSTVVSSPSSTQSSPSAKARVCRSYETLTTHSSETIMTGSVRLNAVRDYEADLRALMEEMKDYYEDHAGTMGDLNEKAMNESNAKVCITATSLKPRSIFINFYA